MKITLPSFFSTKEELIKQPEKRGSVLNTASLSFGTTISTISDMQSMQLSTVYRCVEVITDTIASLPFEPIKRNSDGSKQIDYSHMSYDILNIQPNSVQSRFTFIKTLISNVLLYGNGYAYINRDANGNAVSLRLLSSSDMTVLSTIDKTEVSYKHPLIEENISSYNMIHILNFSYDGIKGVSTLYHAGLATSIARSGDINAQNFFSGGANLSGILTVKDGLNDGQAEEIQAKWKNNLTPNTGNPNGIMVIEGDSMEFKPISINPADAQMLESRKFSVIEICRFFGVSPIKAFDTTASTYNNIEQANLSFLTDTLSPLIEKVENEFNRKLFRPSEKKIYSVQFNVDSLLRGDLAAQSEYFSKLFQIGVLTANDIRKKLNMAPIPGGDIAFVQSSLLPIDAERTAVNKVDNQSKPKTV